MASFGLTAAFTGTVQSGCVPLVVDFTDASTGGPISWSYDFDDGGSSTAQNPRYTFTKAGKYTVKLTVSDGVANSSATLVIIVRKNPVADFKVTRYEYCPGETVNFLNATQSGDTTIRSSSWDFGDGSVTSSNGNVSKTYNNGGSYTVKLTVRDNHNCVSTVSKSGFITVNTKPNPVFSTNYKYSCISPQRVNFINNSGNSVSYVWDLGDGTTTTLPNPVVFYTDEKTYKVTLTATSDKGCTATISQNIVVQFGKVKAAFDADAFTGCIPYNPKFKNQSQPVGAKLDYAWDFGDGSKSTAENPNKNYIKTGTFQVKLRVSGNGAGCADSITKTMLISDKPKATLTQGDTLECDGNLSAMFKASTTSDIEKYTWFIDGKNINTQIDSINYEFKETGIYNVVVLLIDKAGCQQTFAFKRTVVQHLYSGFYSGLHGGCAPYAHMIIDTTNSKLASTYSYKWEDGQGNTYYNQVPPLLYKDTGRFELKQYVTDMFGCEDFAWDYVYAGIKIKPDFSIDKKEMCNNEDIKMTNTTADSLRPFVHKWIWEFGNNKGNNEESFTSSIRDYPRRVSPLLIAINNECRDSCLKEDSVKIKPTLADFVFSFDTCNSLTGTIKHKSILADDHLFYLPGGIKSKDTLFHFPFKPGKKETFSLSAINKQTGCKDSVTQEITPPASTSNLRMTKLNGCTPQVFLLENYLTSSYRSHWDLGNGDTFAIKDSFRYTFHVPGKYTVEHTGWDIRSCPYSSKVNIVVDGPTAGGKIWPDKGCLPLNIQLIDSVSNGKVKRKYWKFEDDPQWRKATNKNEVINYTINNMPSSGDTFFHITLFVEDSNGCQTSKIYKVRPSGPKAGVSINADSRCDAVEYSFNASLDSASAYYPVSMDWDLGDGNTRKTDKFKYIYEKGGKYKISLKITDGLGCSLNQQLNLNTTPPELLAKFSASQTSAICPPLIVNFFDESITDPNNTVQSYYWDFGDGTHSTAKNPSKIYTQAGDFEVKLTVYNSFNCSSTTAIKGYIHVGGPKAAYNFTPKQGCLPVKCNFTALSTPNTVIEWDFGDGYTSKDRKTEYQYKKAGTYFPKLLLRDSGGCQVIVVPDDSILIHPGPEARFVFNTQCLDDSITFESLSLSGMTGNKSPTCRWTIETKDYDTSKLKYKFNTLGDKTVQLIVTNEALCKDTLERIIPITKPVSQFELSEKLLCLSDSLRLINKSTSNHGFKSNQYYVDDKTLSGFKFKAGDYTLKLISTDTFNCSDTFVMANKLHVADTASPNRINIIRVSHLQDRLLELLVEPSNDIDYKNYKVYKFSNNLWEPIITVQDKSTDSLVIPLNGIKKSECFLVTQTNLCDAESSKDLPHCSVHIDVEAGTNQNIIRWNLYGGWPVTQYIIERSGQNGVFDIIGTTDGNSFKYTDTTIICKQTHSYRVKALGQQFSYSDTAKAKAKWENRLPKSSHLLVSVEKDTAIRLNWEKNETYQRSQILGYLLTKNDETSQYNVSLHPDSSNYLDKRVNVDLKSYNYGIRILDDCGDSGQIGIKSSSIHLRRKSGLLTDAPGLVWNPYIYWKEGVRIYKVQRLNEFGLFETIAETRDTTYVDEGTQTSCIKNYTYRVIAVLEGPDNKESYSNAIRIKPQSTIFIPNAFSPNGNGINEVFGAEGQYLYDFNMEIYSIWGEKLYESNACYGTWDGVYKGEICEQNVYFYRISVKGTDGEYYVRSGTFTLLR